MANGQPGLSPLQQFIGQYMETQGFLEQLRAQAAQEALVSRQVENQEIQQFFEFGSQVQNPDQLNALVDFFGTRNPNLKDALTGLAEQITPTLQTQMAGRVAAGTRALTPEQLTEMDQAAALQAFTGMAPGEFAQSRAVSQLSPETWQRAIAISQGRELSKGDEEQLRLAWSQLGLDTARFDEQIRQFGQEMGLRWAAQKLNEFSVTQQGELGRLNAMTSGGLLPPMLITENERDIRELRMQLEEAADPKDRAQLQSRIVDLETSNKRLDEFWMSQQGRGGAGGLQGMTMTDALGAAEKAFDDIIASTSPGEKEAAIERYNMVRLFLGLSPLQNRATLFNPRQGETQFIPQAGQPQQPVPPWFGPRP